MANKQAILDNVVCYSADQLAGFILDGIVTYQELCEDTDGDFSASVRKEVKQILDEAEILKRQQEAAQAPKVAEDVRATVGTDSIQNTLNREELAKEIKHIQADKNVIDKDSEIYNTIVGLLGQGKIVVEGLLDLLGADHNILRASVVKKLYDDGQLTDDDFWRIGIAPRFVEHLRVGRTTQGFDIPRKLERINKLSTEVYFWGIPSSGKSCALGAILSVAGNGRVARSMRKDNDCQGYGYMTRLAALFNGGQVGTLPAGTSIYSTYEMGFDLEDQGNAEHPLTCIDLAGELVRCMYKSDANEMMSDDEAEALNVQRRDIHVVRQGRLLLDPVQGYLGS